MGIFRWRVHRCAVLLAAVLCLSVQAQTSVPLPALGDGAELSTSAERRLGDRIARALYRDPDYIDDPVLAEYVQQIWVRLMAAARARGELSPELEERFAWVISLGRDRSLNAFALPGGYLGVHLGLIGAVSSADELASVLAHELSHVTQRHIARLISQSSAQAPWLLGSLILGMLAAAKNPQAASAMVVGGQAMAAQGQLNFSRDMEREADRVGYGVMTDAGFAPRGFVAMFEKLQQAARHNDMGNFPYLRSHPLTSERIADMQARQSLLPAAGPAETLPAHVLQAARARVLSQGGIDGLRATQADAAALAGTADATSQGATRRLGVLYAAALGAARLRELDVAWRWWTQLQPLLSHDRQADRLGRLLGAELALQGGDGQRALELLGGATSGDLQRPELLLAVQAWMQTGQTEWAAERLRTWVAAQPRDATAWQALANVLRAQQQAIPALRAEAEAHVAQLDEEAALNRLRAAQDLMQRGTRVDHIEASIIDSRVRQLEARAREQALER